MTTATRKPHAKEHEPPRDEAAGQAPAAPVRPAPAPPAAPAAAGGPPDLHAIAQALAAPFDVAEVKFKPQTISGSRALAVPFVDARVIQDRLDDVLGILGWQDSYEVLADGSVVCRLKIRLGDEWITKEDVGGMSEQPDEGDKRKSSFSDALKRAAVKFGIGRYLYRQKPQWVDYDAQKRQFTRPPRLPDAAAAEAQPPAAPGVAFHRRLQEYDAKLAGQGLCGPGDLVKHVARAGKLAGFAPDMTAWGEPEVKLARDRTKAFEAERRGEARAKLEARLGELLDALGETVDRVNAKVGGRKGRALSELTDEQMARAIAALEEQQKGAAS